MKSIGLGDIVHYITVYSGIKWLVLRFVDDCGCDERRERLNEISLKFWKKPTEMQLRKRNMRRLLKKLHNTIPSHAIENDMFNQDVFYYIKLIEDKIFAKKKIVKEEDLPFELLMPLCEEIDANKEDLLLIKDFIKGKLKKL